MESDIDTLIRSVMSLAILSLIPMVIFAIWLDSFEKDIKDLMIKTPDFEKGPELERIRLFSLMVLIFQFMLFLGSDDVRTAYPLLCDLILVVSVGGQLTLQLRAEKLIQTDKNSAENALQIILKAARSWFVAALICGVLSILGVILGRWVAYQMNLRESLGIALLISGGITGMGLGLFLNFALTPYYILKILPSSPLKTTTIEKLIHTTFQEHQFKTPKLWLIELQKFRVFDIIITGLKTGQGPFEYSLFISQFTLSTLSESEIRSILLIEISHLKLNHLRNRLTLAAALISNSLIFSILASLTISKIFPNYEGSEFIGTTLGFFFFVFSVRWIAIQRQTQEFEGDVFALDHLNLDYEAFSMALRKLDYESIKQTHPEHVENLPLMGFPDTERRLFLLSNYLTQKALKRQPPEAEKKAA